MKTQEKKFFAPTIKTYGNDLSKRWRIEWDEFQQNGILKKRHVKYGDINKGKTCEERIDFANRLIQELLSHNPKPTPESEKISKKNVLLETLKLSNITWRKSTARAYSTITNSFINFIGDIHPEDINSSKVNEYILYLREDNASSHKVRKYVSHIKTMYEKAIDFGFLEKNPIPKLKLKKPKAKSLLFFTDDQIKLIKESAIPEELLLGIQLLFYCFIRPGEARLLKISDLNLQYNFIEIPAEVSKNNKTQKVAIPIQIKDKLQSLLQYPRDNYIIGINGIPGTEPIPERRLYKLHKKLLVDLNIMGHYSLYSWKHTGVVKVVKAGINIKDLQLQLRHHSLDMVNEYLKNLGVLDSEDLINKYPTL